MHGGRLVPVFFALVACATHRRASDDRLPSVRDTASLESIEVIRAVGPMQPHIRQALTDTAHAAMARWARVRPERYRLRVLERSSCFEIRTSEAQPARRDVYEIVGDSIVGSTLETIPDSLRRACRQRWRVEDLFARLLQDLANRSVAVEGIEYDTRYWYPRRYRVTGGSHGDVLVIADYFDARSP